VPCGRLRHTTQAHRQNCRYLFVSDNWEAFIICRVCLVADQAAVLRWPAERDPAEHPERHKEAAIAWYSGTNGPNLDPTIGGTQLPDSAEVQPRPPRKRRVLLAFEAFKGFADDGLDGSHFIVGHLLKFAFAPLAA
jgi:hypothetical protein